MRIHIILFHVLYTMTESSTMTWTICKIIPIHLVYIDRQENVTECNNISYFFRKKKKKYISCPISGSGFWANQDTGLFQIFKILYINILDNFQSLLFCFHTFGVKRPCKPQSPGSRSLSSMERDTKSMKQKIIRLLKLFRIFIYQKKYPFVRCTKLWIRVFWPETLSKIYIVTP